MMKISGNGPRPLAQRALYIITVLLVLTLPVVSFAQDASRHVVEPGDTLFRIARTYGITLESLRQANRISGDDIRVGQVLVIPSDARGVDSSAVAPSPSTQPDRAVRESAVKDSIIVPVQPDSVEVSDVRPSRQPEELSSRYVRPDQSLYDFAFSVGLEVDTLMKLNPALPVFLDSTRVLIPSDHSAGPSTTYTVRTGDTLYKIARQHGTSLQALRRLNRLTTDVIRVGQKLEVAGSAVLRTARKEGPPLIATGNVRPYPSSFAGRLMAGGKEYDPDRYYVSHSDLPFGSIVLLSNLQDGSLAFAEVADRLPSTAEYAMDVSVAVALALDVGGKSNPDIEVRVVRFGKGD